MIKLLDEGAMPFRMVGTHRRIRLADVMVYKATKDRYSDAAMDDLVAQAQELKLGYFQSQGFPRPIVSST